MSAARAASGSGLSQAAVRDFRQRCLDNGYRPIRLRTGSKQPAGKNWQNWASTDQLFSAAKDELNTGISGFQPSACLIIA